MNLQLHSEQVPPTGALSATGALNVLGRPVMGPWELFVRETIQNSWDAKIPGSTEPVGFAVAIRKLSRRELKVLNTRILGGMPDDGNCSQWDCVQDPDQYVLEVSDSGTTGLGGSTRADRVGDGPSDFADFMFNVGQAPDKARGGGTYGYGKTVLYLASKAATICVYTRCMTSKGHGSRFMAAALGHPFTAPDGSKRTGRHWWGLSDRQGVLRPAVGDAADLLAHSIGLPVRSGAETGTTVIVVAADLEEGPEAVADRMRAAALWYCWPKVLDSSGGPDMELTFSCLGDALPPIDPTTHPELRHFVYALEAARAAPGKASAIPIVSQKPKRALGSLALRSFATPSADQVDGETRPLEGQCAHVALLRAPNLVLRYLPGPESPIPGTSWAGVFVADDGADRDFAASETPTHDDWVPVNVDDRRKRSAVKVALARIRDAVRDWNRPHITDSEAEARPLGTLADALGGLLHTDMGTGSGSLPEGINGGGAAPRTGARAKVDRGNDQLVLHDGRPAVLSRFKVSPAERSSATIVEPRIRVAVNDGAGVESDPPLGAATPQLIHFVDPEGVVRKGDHVVIDASDDREWSMLVSLPPDTAVVVAFETSGARD